MRHARGRSFVDASSRARLTSTWGYYFWSARPRTINFVLHGFHDNGLAPDTDFRLQLGLSFRLVWAMVFTEPTQKTMVTSLEFLPGDGRRQRPPGGHPRGRGG